MVFPEGGKCKEAEDLLAVQTQIPPELRLVLPCQKPRPMGFGRYSLQEKGRKESQLCPACSLISITAGSGVRRKGNLG
jgi:hypothetical protein